MPTRNKLVKQETRVDKINSEVGIGRSKLTEHSVRGRTKHITDASLVRNPCECQSRSEKLPLEPKGSKVIDGVTHNAYVPVVGVTKKPLMPCHPARARELVRKGRALRRFSKGIFYIQLKDREDGDRQVVALGIDPGSKREAFTVKSKKHTYLNVLSDAVDWVKDAVEVRRNMRRARRFRKTPCRKNRWNRTIGGIPPSTKARWNAKLRIVEILSKLYPLTNIVVEDISAKTIKNAKRWNKSFSPLQVGKLWFYKEVANYGKLQLKSGWETKLLRDQYGLKKIGNKKAEVFASHNVDSWVLAYTIVGGDIVPENTSLFKMSPIKFHRRMLHRLQPEVGGKRNRYGGTISLGFKKGSLVKHKKLGVCYVGGNTNGRITLCDLGSGKRLTQKAKPTDCNFLCYNQWKSNYIRW